MTNILGWLTRFRGVHSSRQRCGSLEHHHHHPWDFFAIYACEMEMLLLQLQVSFASQNMVSIGLPLCDKLWSSFKIQFCVVSHFWWNAPGSLWLAWWDASFCLHTIHIYNANWLPSITIIHELIFVLQTFIIFYTVLLFFIFVITVWIVSNISPLKSKLNTSIREVRYKLEFTPNSPASTNLFIVTIFSFP